MAMDATVIPGADASAVSIAFCTEAGLAGGGALRHGAIISTSSVRC